jgi:hypothetical protein
MRQRFVLTSLALLFVLGFAEIASAQAVYCLAPSGFGNRFRITVTPMGGTLLINGVENVFADRTVIGTGQLGVRTPGTYRLGWTYIGVLSASATNSTWNIVINAASGAGTYDAWNDAFGVRTSGGISVVSCAGVPDEELRALPDIAEVLAGQP